MAVGLLVDKRAEKGEDPDKLLRICDAASTEKKDDPAISSISIN